MTAVLIIVIVLLLVVLGAGTAVHVRRRHLDSSEHDAVEARVGTEPAARDAAPDDGGGVALATREAEAPQAADEPLLLPAPEEVRGRPGLAERLGRARDLLGAPLGAIRGRARIDETTFDDLEEALLIADVGLATTTRLLDDLRARVRSGELDDKPAALLDALKADVVALFDGEDRELHLAETSPSVWLFVGVNGVGKTTTIGKLAALEIAAGRSAVLAAGDTFRAAAGDQLALWAERSGAAIVRGADGADPSSVVFDAIQHAAARGASLVLADTAGRLHTKLNLMDELRKVRRVADRPPGTVTEVLLVLDATTGQNGLVQAREFADAVEVTGIVLTKLDGTAKGGIVCAIRSELGLPIKLVGLGEGLGDLVAFEPEEFAEALFS
ncbi:MAG: ftsY [Acidimicrobiaceae bacterium]|jgi:fused signal recognition particle receptor|nr:ftsY [Acidimicrobiaceae bacterium]